MWRRRSTYQSFLPLRLRTFFLLPRLPATFSLTEHQKRFLRQLLYISYIASCVKKVFLTPLFIKSAWGACTLEAFLNSSTPPTLCLFEAAALLVVFSLFSFSFSSPPPSLCLLLLYFFLPDITRLDKKREKRILLLSRFGIRFSKTKQRQDLNWRIQFRFLVFDFFCLLLNPCWVKQTVKFWKEGGGSPGVREIHTYGSEKSNPRKFLSRKCKYISI